MRPKIAKENLADEYFTQERCYILELPTPVNDDTLSIARARVEPGVTTARHVLKGIDEHYVITVGTGIVEVGNLPPTNVLGGDVVFIPAGIPQRITNTGNIDLIFYCICTPPFKIESYVDLDTEKSDKRN